MSTPSVAVAGAPGTTPRSKARARHRKATPVLALVAAMATGTGVWAGLHYQQEVRHQAPVPPATLLVSSVPSGALVQVDGHEHGRTPARIAVSPGEHRLTFTNPRAMVARATVRAASSDTVDVTGTLWLQMPTVQRLKPPFPGASVADATFLADGSVALAVTLPPGSDHELWVQATQGGPRPLGPATAHGPMAITGDGAQVAYLAPGTPTTTSFAPSDQQLSTVWTVPSTGGTAALRYALPPANQDDHLTDLSWAPDGKHLLVVARQQAASGTRTRLLWLDVTEHRVQPLVTLPSIVVPGSFQWSPRGDQVALLTQASSLVSLCLLTTTPPSFRYLVDLSHDDSSPVPYPPVSWSPDGASMAFTAPTTTTSGQLGGALFGPQTTMGLFLTSTVGTESQRVGTVAGRAPLWRDDGRILTLTRTDGRGPLVVQATDPRGVHTEALGTIPLPGTGIPAARWDQVHGQALLAIRHESTPPDFWLVRFIPEVQP